LDKFGIIPTNPNTDIADSKHIVAFLILGKRGNILSIRKTEDMEEGKGYNKTKVKKFLPGRLD